MSFSCLVVSSEVLLLSLGLPVCGSNGQFKFTSSSGGYFHKEHRNSDGFMYLSNKVIRERKQAYFVFNIVFVTMISSIMLLLTSCEVYVLTPIGNLMYDYEPSLVRIGIRTLKEDFLLALIDI